MRKIAFISKGHIIKNIGGAEVQADILAQELSRIGRDVKFITWDIEQRQNFKNYELIPSPNDKLAFKEVLSEVNADVYYQRGRKELTDWVGEYCKETGKKFVFATSMDIDCRKHKFCCRNNDSLKSLFKNLIKFNKNLKLDKISLMGMRRADVILCQTMHQQKILKTELGIRSELFYNVHNKPDASKKTHQNNAPVVLWLANLKDWKQPEIFLRLAQDMVDVDCKFIMAGHIKSQKYKNLIQKTKNINDNFEFLGGVTFSESNSLIANADIFVNTSKKQEGFPNTFIQSWLRGVPTVTLLFDPDELITRYNLGFCSKGNYIKMRSEILKLLNDKELCNKISENAKSFSTKNFLIEEKINLLTNIL